MMKRVKWSVTAVLGLALVVGVGTASAQPGPGSEVKKLETELAKLKEKAKEVEASLEKAKAAEKKFGGKKGPPFGPGGFGGFFGKGPKGGFGPKGGADKKEMFERFKKEFEAKKGEGWGGFRGGFGRRPAPKASAPGELEKKLDQLSKDLEDLRRELRKKR